MNEKNNIIYITVMLEYLLVVVLILLAANWMGYIKLQDWIPLSLEGYSDPPDSVMGITEKTLNIPKPKPYVYAEDIILP